MHTHTHISASLEAASILQNQAAVAVNTKVAINDSISSESVLFNNVHFIFLGEGAKKTELREKATVLNLKNVLFLDSVPKSEVVRYWSLLYPSYLKPQHCWLPHSPQSHSLSMAHGALSFAASL